MIDEEASSTKGNLLTVIRKSRNHIDKKYFFKLVKSMFKRIKAAIRAQRQAIKKLILIFCQ